MSFLLIVNFISSAVILWVLSIEGLSKLDRFIMHAGGTAAMTSTLGIIGVLS